MKSVKRSIATKRARYPLQKRKRFHFRRFIDAQKPEGSVQTRFFVLLDPLFRPFSIA